MWKRVKSSNLFLSYTDDYEICVTDYITIWTTYLTKERFLQCLKECNPLLEMTDEALLTKGNYILSNPDHIKKLDERLEGTTLTINMTMLFKYSFKLNLKLLEGSKETFFQKITQPLLSTILELKNSQTELCQLLNKKDSEIQEYKCEGGEIALKHLKTKPFNEQAVLSKLPFSARHIVNDFIQLTEIQIQKNNNIIKTEAPEVSTALEPVRVKTEDSPESLDVKPMHDMPIKIETHLLKEEPCSENHDEGVSEIVSSTSVSTTLSIKQDSELSIKRESQSIPKTVSIRNKMKKIF